MATITAAAGGGNWSVTGTWVGGVVPTAADDVVLNGTSGNVTVNAASVCRSLNCTGYVGTLTHNAFNLTIGDATAGAGNVALKLVAGMTYALANATTSALVFASTSATFQTVDFGEKAHGNLTFSGATGNWAIASAMNQDATASVTQSGGTVRYDGATDNAGLSHSIGAIQSSGSAAKTFIFGSSTTTLKRSTAATVVNIPNGVNNTVSSASAAFIMAASSSGKIVYKFTMPSATVVGTLTMNSEGECQITTRNTFGTITRNCHNVVHDQINFPYGTTTTITSALNIIGNGSDYRVTAWPDNNAMPSTLVITGATLNCQYVDWQDIKFDNGGGNVDLSAHVGGSGDAGGNSIINGGTLTFTSATTQTWAGGAGNWSNAAKWTSRAPLPQDSVVISSVFAGEAIQVDRKFAAKNVTVTGSGSVVLNANIYECYFLGDVTFRSGLSWTKSASCDWLLAPRAAATFSSNGASILIWINIQAGNGGNLTFSDGSTVDASVLHRSGTITIPSGSTQVTWYDYTSNANTVGAECKLVLYGRLRLTKSSGALVTLTNGATYTSFEDRGGQLRASATAAGAKTLNTYGLAMPDVAVAPNSAGSLAISGGGSFPRLPGPWAAGTANITLAAGSTTTTRNPGQETPANGTSVYTLTSSSAGSAATISKAAGQFAADYLSLQDIAATGGAVFQVGANSVNTSGNAGMTFTSATTWVPQAA